MKTHIVLWLMYIQVMHGSDSDVTHDSGPLTWKWVTTQQYLYFPCKFICVWVCLLFFFLLPCHAKNLLGQSGSYAEWYSSKVFLVRHMPCLAHLTHFHEAIHHLKNINRVRVNTRHLVRNRKWIASVYPLPQPIMSRSDQKVLAIVQINVCNMESKNNHLIPQYVVSFTSED